MNKKEKGKKGIELPETKKTVKFNYGIKRSKSETQKPIISDTTDKCINLEDRNQKTCFEKLKSLCSSKAENKRESKPSLKTFKSNDEKLKTVSSLCTKNRKKQSLKKLTNEIKKSKQEIEKPVKSLRSYIEQKCKWTISLFVVYTIIFGAIVSTPVLVKHFQVISQNETEQERSINYRI